jgi:hypothetical protein
MVSELADIPATVMINHWIIPDQQSLIDDK